jgi:diguanylate cyclase (GGDEF)-like protein/PAS domain S-box-containing protein
LKYAGLIPVVTPGCFARKWKTMHTIIASSMKLMNEIRSEYAFAPEHDSGLERHIFRLICLTIFLLAFLILIPSNLFQDISYLVSVPTALCGGVSFALYRAARKGSNHLNAMLVVILGTLNVTWFMNGGSEGSVPYFIFPICLYPLIVFHGWKRWLVLAGIVANGCMLIALSYRHPWIVTAYENRFDQTVDLMVGMLSCSVTISVLVWAVLNTYRREQERLKLLNLKLEQEVDDRMRTEDELFRSNKEFAATEEKFRTVADYTENWEFWLGTDGRFNYTSPSSAKITGYDAQAFYADPGLMERIVHPEDRKFFARHFQRSDYENRTKSLSFRINHADGSIRWLELVWRSIVDADGTFRGIRGSNRDITGHKETQEALKRSEGKFRTIFNSSADPIIICDQNLSIIEVNDVACQRLGNSRDDLLRMDYLDIICEKYRGKFIILLEKILSMEQVTYESRLATADGTEIPVEISTKIINFEGCNVILSVSRDITERKRAEAEIEHMAYHDALTGLPNRLLLDDRLSQAIAHADRFGNMIGVLCFDLDNFKSVNDSLTHPVGDLLLKKVSERLGRRLRKSDSLARMGGDEFIVVLPDIAGPEEAAHAARLFLEEFSEPFQLDGQEIYTSTSVGISLYPMDGTSTATLLKNADMAMYEAKKLGRNLFQFHTEEINRRAEERLLLENDLRRAINRNEFVLQYQPWFDLATDSIGGVEALIRWVHPERGIISPARFIPIAEETGLIVPIGEWIMRTACRFLEEMHRRGLGRFTASVNVSGVQLRNPDLIGLLKALLADAVFDPSRLELELTESSVMENLEESRRYMDALKKIGVRLAIDDFGTGYSSLTYLKRFPLDRLKIDRSFVKDCPDNPDDVAIARAVIALARSLNLEVTAEGVENLQQADFFSRENCDVIQGNYICKPLPENELLRLLCTKARNPA